jgi:formylglycine-generating enzyme required for sulfatase activity
MNIKKLHGNRKPRRFLKPSRFWAALPFLLFRLLTNAQTITNVNARQQGREVHISYDIFGASLTDKFTIQVFMGTDQGWQGPLTAVKGHVGPNVAGGCCKKIIWRALDERNYFKGTYQFKIIGESESFSESDQDLHLTTAYEPQLIYVKGGNFWMGSFYDSPDNGEDENPKHKVKVSSFYMGKFEVTYGEFKTFVGETGYITDAEREGSEFNWRSNFQGLTDKTDENLHPVVYISWYDTQAYIKWLNRKTGKKYRLPTEAEWEFAAKGGTGSKGFLFSGSNNIDSVACYKGNSRNHTHAVGQKQPNELGLFDMTGNVWEWCQDWYDASYYSSRPDLDVNPQGGSPAKYKIRRGGSWLNDPAFCRVSNRDWDTLGFRRQILGFRLVLPSR